MIRIGTQGWNYDAWQGAFYPRGTRATDYLDLYWRIFDTVEVDSTFYAIPSAAAIATWRKRAPQHGLYALKLTQEITHVARLVECESILTAFCERVRGLGDRLGSILIQLPPDFSPRALPALIKFLPHLPTDLHFAVEFRDRAWLQGELGESVLNLLTEYCVAPALTDSKWLPRELMFELLAAPPLQRALMAAQFAYVRWLGPRSLTDFSHVQLERTAEMSAWAAAFRQLNQLTPLIYGYFNNHFQGHSPASANRFKALLGLPVTEAEALIVQPALF